MTETKISFGEPYTDKFHKNLKQNIFIRDGKYDLKCKNNCYPTPTYFLINIE